MKENIKEQYKKNFEFIKKFNVKAGDTMTYTSLIYKEPITETIKAINSYYGWICSNQGSISINRIIAINKQKVK